jgi:hypothetical protein
MISFCDNRQFLASNQTAKGNDEQWFGIFDRSDLFVFLFGEFLLAFLLCV